MTATVVQTAVNMVTGGTSVTVTLDSTPTVGNRLVAFVLVSNFYTITNTGFTEQHNYSSTGSGANACIRIYIRDVQSGDGTSWTVSQNLSDSFTVIIAEVAGADDPATWTFDDAGTDTASVSDILTLTTGDLALVAGSSRGGSSAGVSTITPTGYTTDQTGIPSSHTGVLGEAVATGSSQTFTTTWDGSPNPVAQVVVSIPAPTTPTADGITEIPLEWSATIYRQTPVSTPTGVDSDEDDAWQIPLEWTCLVDLNPADDVEGDP